jgi:simple sugar transport system permease protein
MSESESQALGAPLPAPPAVQEGGADDGSRSGSSAASRLSRPLDALIRGVGPVVLALLVAAILLLALGRDPVRFYSDIWNGGVGGKAWQDSATRMAPLLLIAGGLIVVFRANIWNLGYDGQVLLAAAIVGGRGPPLAKVLPVVPLLVVLFLAAGATGALWTLLPAFLKARFEVNEIVTTQMTSFVGISLAAILVKGPFQYPTTNVAQTRVIAIDQMLPTLPGTTVSISVIIALVVILIVHFVMTRTANGLRLFVLGASRRAAFHAGLRVGRIITGAFVASGALIGFAAAAEILGIWGYVRAEWNPGFGSAVIPLVFLARLNALAVIPFIAFYSVLSIGGDVATQHAELPIDFLLVVVGLILIFMTLTEYLGNRRDLGGSYLTAGMRRALKRGDRDA